MKFHLQNKYKEVHFAIINGVEVIIEPKNLYKFCKNFDKFYLPIKMYKLKDGCINLFWQNLTSKMGEEGYNIFTGEIK